MGEVRNRTASAPHWGPPKRAPSALVTALTVAGVVVGLVGGLASLVPVLHFLTTPVMSGASFAIDSAKANLVSSNEREYRAQYYTSQIFKQLGIAPAPGRVATVDEFRQAAVNPNIKKLYDAPGDVAAKEIKSSGFSNAAIAAVGTVLPGAGAVGKAAEAVSGAVEVHKAVKLAKAALPMLGMLGAGVAGNALAEAISRDEVDPQTLIEGMHQAIADAVQRGQRPQVPANLVFLLRVSQDPAFAEEIKMKFGGGKLGFHQMNAQQQAQVMGTFRALADAATAEANEVSTGRKDVRELAATTPNLNSRAAAYQMGAENATYQPPVVGSFTAREAARRGSPVAPAARIQPRAGGFAAAVDAQRAVAPKLLS